MDVKSAPCSVLRAAQHNVEQHLGDSEIRTLFIENVNYVIVTNSSMMLV